jgi:hypothetical protein
MSDNPQTLADHLLVEGGRVIDFFNNLTEEQWEIHIYPQESEWTMHHLLAHFVSSEIGRKALISDVCCGGNGAPTNFDIDKFNQREVDRLLDISNTHLLESFSRERNELIAIISDLKNEDLNRIGNDPYLGITTLSQMIKLTYRHLQIRLREVRRCL